MPVNIMLLEPETRRRFGQLQTASMALNITIIPVQGLRTFAEQDALYAIGRSKPGKIVTNASAGQSWHNYGMAFDVGFSDGKGGISWDQSRPWALLGAMGEIIGLTWGGRFKLVDLGHFEFHPGLTLDDAYKQYVAGEGFVKPV